jgi:hypothetical protein
MGFKRKRRKLSQKGYAHDKPPALLAFSRPILYFARRPIMGRLSPMIIIAEIIGFIMLVAALISLAAAKRD